MILFFHHKIFLFGSSDNDGSIEFRFGGSEYTVTIDGNQETTQNDGFILFENLGPGAYEIQINDLNGH